MMGFGFGGLGLIFMLIFWVVIIGLAVWVLGTLFPRAPQSAPPQASTRPSGPAESAVEILKQRYARGEISKAEYEQMLQDLTG
ncbi:MAG TPA: SHOCT domain-containing protein [Caldilineae bacterium]|jgi:putative membrane protein|nr:SHOCT domain-containing protein [Caldilineae bacterium]